jgi:hypothetical protein
MDTATDEAARVELSRAIYALIEKLLDDVDEAATASGRAFTAFDLIVFLLHTLAHYAGHVIGPVELLEAQAMAESAFTKCDREGINAAFAGIMENLGLELELPV